MPLFMTLAGEFGYGRTNSPPFINVDLISFSIYWAFWAGFPCFASLLAASLKYENKKTNYF
jgi:hypothetical protein